MEEEGNAEFALFQCQACHHKQRLLVLGPKECQRCGGVYERVLHPLQAYDELGITDSIIANQVDELMADISRRLEAERELDRIDALRYNERKGGHDGEEEYDRD